MPIKEFLEEYPLYRKIKTNSLPVTLDKVRKISINMPCNVCESNQTFTMKNEYYDEFRYMNHPTKGAAVKLAYQCSHCNIFQRIFFVKFSDDDNNKWIMKVGQFPPWEILSDKNIDKLLGSHTDYYTKGRICEYQGYGIGAFGYYLRVLENILNDILAEKSGLTSYATLTIVDKIERVNNLLPSVLRVDGINFLSTLYSILSNGLHSQTDEECLEFAQNCRETLVFLITHVAADKEATLSFTTNLKRLIDKIAASTEYELNLMSVDNAIDILEEGNSLVVVATIGKDLHIRVFDYTGKRIFDKPESELADQSLLAAFKKQLEEAAGEFSMSKESKRKIIDIALLLVSSTAKQNEPKPVVQNIRSKSGR